MPPETPRTISRGSVTGASLALGVLEQPGVDLTHGHGERLLARARLDERADVLEKALAELGVVVVDLACALGRVDDQRVLGAHRLQQLVDRGVGDALRSLEGAAGPSGGDAHSLAPAGVAPDGDRSDTRDGVGGTASRPARLTGGPTLNSTNRRAVSPTSWLTTVTSNSLLAASSSRAVARRRSTTSVASVPRPIRRPTSTSQDGGSR